MFKYYINETLSQDKDFLDFLSDSTISFFKSEHCITLFKNEKSELKYFKNNDLIYIFLQQNNQIQVLKTETYSFEVNKDIQEMINYNEEKFNKGEKIYSSQFIFNCDFEQTKPNFTEEELNDPNYLSNLLSEIKETENLDELLSKYKLYLEELTSFSKKEKTIFSENTLNIYNYILLLNSFGYKNEHYDSDFFVKCLINIIPNFTAYTDDITIKFNSLNQTVKTHQFNLDNKYSFNDCDNHLFETKYGFIFSDQAFNFYVHFINKENFTVFIIDNYERVQDKIKNIEKMIENNNYDLLNDIVLKIEDNKMTYVNSLHFQSRFYDDLKFTVESLQSENLLTVSYPIDIHSYQYQRDYFCHTYKQTELNFLIQVFLVLGSGFNYDPVKGVFFEPDFNYSKDIPKYSGVKISEVEKIDKLVYFYLRNFSYLNEDWKNALKSLLLILKRDKPECSIFSQKTLELTYKKAFKVLKTLE